MATIKSCTDIKQSRKLAKILPLESADMFYSAGNETQPTLRLHSYGHIMSNKDVCAWSLAALLSVLPDTITSNDGIAFKLNIKKNIIEYSNPSLYLVYKSIKSDNLVDACVAMIEKLNERKML